MRAGGKDTPAKSQPFVIYDLKSTKYFANRVARLAKWQSTRSREIVSLHRFVSFHCMHFIAPEVGAKYAMMQCIERGVAAMTATCNDCLAYSLAGGVIPLIFDLT
jgi:hypothetical protein